MSSARWIGLIAIATACAPTYKTGPHDSIFQKSPAPILHAKPAGYFDAHDWWDEGLHSIILPATKLANPGTLIGLATGGAKALDVNAFGQVPDSLWFENRIARGKISSADIASGPDAKLGPAPGPLTITSGKLQGVSPGFVVKDSSGVTFFVKFDPPSFPRLASGAEIVATRLLGAAGYHVPDNFLVELDLSRLVLDPRARTRNGYNRSVPLTQEALTILLGQLNPNPSGILRAFFSRSVPGEPIGPFRYRGVREGDPNDTIPHERRRSLRGLWVFSAWLNNIDGRHHNSMDTFIAAGEGSGNPALGVIKHYLIDFGASLGSASIEEKTAKQGHERRLEWSEMALRLITLGFRDPTWFRVSRSPYREVGIFESQVFDPATWAPSYNNPAYNAADADDTFWAASILAHFTTEDIEAAASAAQYRERGATQWVAEQLEQRRNILLRYAFAKRAPLEYPRVTGGVFRLTDLVVLAELAESRAGYQFRVRWQRTRAADRAIGLYVKDVPELELASIVDEARTRFGSDFERDPFLVITVRRSVNGVLGPELDVVVRASDSLLLPVALTRR